QENRCGLLDEESSCGLSYIDFSYSIDPSDLEIYDPVVFNVYYWDVRPHGFTDQVLELEEALASIAALNIAFNEYNIFFKFRGIEVLESPEVVYIRDVTEEGACMLTEEIDEDQFYSILNCQTTDLGTYALSTGNWRHDAFNVYTVGVTIGFGGAATIGSPGAIFMPRYNLDSPTVVHEFGHALGLCHTWHEYNTNYCEAVPRNSSNSDYNATEAGDNVIDTNAVPNFRSEYCYYEDGSADCSLTVEEGGYRFYYIDDCDYTYEDIHVDCTETGYPFEIITADVQNFMAANPRECMESFTVGQAIRMRETIEYDLTNRYSDRMTDVDALYEHYYGEYYVRSSEQFNLRSTISAGV
ncbi:MAG: hypothetical protein HRU26_04880, partial [Psychroserpens sp.]|nr:hypothetical protein [Psychroserpens sp.]